MAGMCKFTTFNIEVEILSKDASSAPAKRIAVDKKDIGHHHDKNPSVWMRS